MGTSGPAIPVGLAKGRGGACGCSPPPAGCQGQDAVSRERKPAGCRGQGGSDMAPFRTRVPPAARAAPQPRRWDLSSPWPFPS